MIRNLAQISKTVKLKIVVDSSTSFVKRQLLLLHSVQVLMQTFYALAVVLPPGADLVNVTAQIFVK